jgi:hypothetical protein
MRLNLQQSNGPDAPFKSTRLHIFNKSGEEKGREEKGREEREGREGREGGRGGLGT